MGAMAGPWDRACWALWDEHGWTEPNASPMLCSLFLGGSISLQPLWGTMGSKTLLLSPHVTAVAPSSQELPPLLPGWFRAWVDHVGAGWLMSAPGSWLLPAERLLLPPAVCGLAIGMSGLAPAP